MKKIIAAVLLTLVFTFNAAANTTESRMLKDLLRYLSWHEMMYSDMLWALDYIESFDRQRTWQALQLARASIAIAMSNIQKYKFPELEMTADDYTKLMRRKIGIGFLGTSEEIFEDGRTTLKNSLVNLENAVMYQVFLEEDWEICMRNVVNRKKEMQYHLQYLAYVTDWVMTSLKDPAKSKTIDGFFEKHCPKTQALRRKSPESLEKIEADVKSNLEQIEQLVLDDAKVAGAVTDRLNSMKYGLSKKDTKLISTRPMKISDLPPLIHTPAFLNNGYDAHYFWKDSSGNSKIPPSCSDLERVPDSCMIRAQGVSLEQVKDYQRELEGEGLRASLSQEQGGKFYLIYKVKGGSFRIVWEDNKVNILMGKDPVCFIPYLYLIMRK